MAEPIVYTQEQLDAMLQAEGDRRVTGALKTAQEKWEQQKQVDLENAKLEWAKEVEATAKLTAEEKAQKAMQEKLNEIANRENEISKKANELNAKEKLVGAGVPSSYYGEFLGVMVTPDKDVTEANIDKLIATYNAMKADIETKVKSEFSKVPPPANGNNGGAVTKTDFDKMSYAEKIKFKTEHPEEFIKFIKES